MSVAEVIVACLRPANALMAEAGFKPGPSKINIQSMLAHRTYVTGVSPPSPCVNLRLCVSIRNSEKTTEKWHLKCNWELWQVNILFSVLQITLHTLCENTRRHYVLPALNNMKVGQKILAVQGYYYW